MINFKKFSIICQLVLSIAWIVYSGIIYAMFTSTAQNQLNVIYYILIIVLVNIVNYYYLAQKLSIYLYVIDDNIMDITDMNDRIIEKVSKVNIYSYGINVIFLLISVIGSTFVMYEKQMYLMLYFTTASLYSTFIFVFMTTRKLINFTCANKKYSNDGGSSIIAFVRK